MTKRTSVRTIAAIALALAATRPAHADFGGSYTGQVVGGKSSQPVSAAGALTQSGRAITGTLVLGTGSGPLDGAYLVSGNGTTRKLRVTGANGRGGHLTWRGTTTTTGATGRIKIRGPGAKLAGKLTLNRPTSTFDGTACDAVFTQNQAFFTSQVMDQVLVPTCATCHIDGGQAQATRLRIVRGDPLATARSVAMLIDTANPGASLLIQKPTAAVPHGGGQQLMPGTPPVQALAQWADLLAQAACVPQGATTASTGVFAQQCAGCHGPDGAGATNAPDVRCSARSILADAVRRGRGTVMPALALSAPDLDTIAAFLDGKCSHQPADVYAANCATCHGATAGGGRNADGVRGPNIRCTDEFGEAVAQGTEGMPAFPSFSGREITALARYVRGFCALGGGGGGGDG